MFRFKSSRSVRKVLSTGIIHSLGEHTPSWELQKPLSIIDEVGWKDKITTCGKEGIVSNELVRNDQGCFMYYSQTVMTQNIVLGLHGEG